MNIRYNVSLIILGITTTFLVSCGEVPQKEIEAANVSIDSAKSLGAEGYAAENFQMLLDSMQGIIEGIEAEKSNFLPNYESAKGQLTYINQQAGEVIKQTEAKKLEIKSQIQTTIADVRDLINTNKLLILEAPKGKEGTSALLAIQGELSAIETAVNETDSLISTGQLLPGLDKATVAKEKAESINAELQGVIDRYKANVKARRS